ncbi:hypothetical protein OSB04_021493 [Centaurea solstitialis]|uniref:H15 domain-containing protein n=1 Tax=Centaurea solstitialis TaxID=347529 RepID=A0AA38T6C9_9ASTR|nr:hypothetical protein OSB04_021493 [Centaurea solstitialis]
MDKLKQALMKFAHSNPSLFPDDATIEHRFSQFFHHLPIPNHPPYAAVKPLVGDGPISSIVNENSLRGRLLNAYWFVSACQRYRVVNLILFNGHLWIQMIHKAIWELQEKGGSSEESISEYIKREYADLPWAHSTLLKHHLEKLCDRKEIRMTHKQSYLIGAADSDPITSSRSEKQLKRKRDSDSGKKSRRLCKKQKSRPDSEYRKESNRQDKKYKKKKEHPLDLQETNKQKVEVVQEEVFQEQDQILQALDEVANEQENIILNGLSEPQNIEIENGTLEQGNGLINKFVLEMEERGVPANPTEENQTEIGKDKVDNKVYTSTHFDDTGNENQSVELVNDKDQTEIHGTKGNLKWKYSKRGKKREINEETQLETSSEPILKKHNDVTDGHSHEQKQTTEVNTTNIEINCENAVGKSVDAAAQNQVDRTENGVAEDVAEQIQTKQNPQLLQLEESPDSNPVLLESKHPGKRISTRSQIKTISKKDASLSSELMESPGYAYLPNGEYSSEEKQQVIETKQVPSAVFTQMTGPRAKLRSSQQKSRSPSLEKPLKELVNPICTKPSPQFSDLDEVETKVQEPGGSQQPDELEDEPKNKGRGRPRKRGRGRPPGAISKKGQQSAEKCKVGSRHPKAKRVEGKGKSADFIQKVKHSHVKKGQQKHESQQPNEEDEPKCNGHGMRKMTRRSNRKKKDPNR